MDNKLFMNNEEHDRHIKKVKLFKIKTKCKKNYKAIFKYDIILINDIECLVKAMTYDNHHNDYNYMIISMMYIIMLKTKNSTLFVLRTS